MLPKVEKAKQLNLVEGLDKERGVKRKRIIVIGLLILTAGLSLGFWAYRKIGLVLREGVKINKEENPPKLSSKIIIKYEPEEEIKKIIEKNQGRWYFYVKSGGYVWSQNFSGINIEETRIELGKIKSEESKLASGLPKGIKIQEKIISAGDGWELKALVTVPNREILMVMGVAETSELEATQALIPSLGQVLYWAGIQN